MLMIHTSIVTYFFLLLFRCDVCNDVRDSGIQRTPQENPSSKSLILLLSTKQKN